MNTKKSLALLTLALLLCTGCAQSATPDEPAPIGQTESADSALQTTDEDKTTPTEPVSEPESTATLVNQNYLGVWYSDKMKTDDIAIYEITEDTIVLRTGIFRLFGFSATAKESNGEIVFTSNDYDQSITGKLQFGENIITVIYDSFGPFEELYPSAERTYQLSIKDEEDSERILEQYKTTGKI